MLLERDVLLHNRYRILDNLGQGGMGSVYLALDENLGVQVAVKENLFTTEEYARQFRLEAVILASIRHPNLPRVSDHFVIASEGQYLIMDFIDGEDLRQRMERTGTLSEDEVIHIGAAMCDALTYLHSRKPAILHRDIKPGNVKISPDGHIFLVDFGLAKVIQGNQATTTGARAMTPGYSPPEQYGTARTDARTDIYSLGATLYAALTGVIPEDGLARAMDSVELTPARKRNPQINKRLAVAIEKAMEVDPGDRFQVAEDFKTALLGAKSKTQQLLGTYTVAPPPTAAERQTQVEQQPKLASELVHSTPVDYPFVSPRKKQKERNRRAFLTFINGALFTLLLGFLAWLFVFPQWVPAAVHARLPFLPDAPVVLVSETAAVIDITPGAASLATPSLALPTPTARPEVILNPDAIATPLGADYLELAYASNSTGKAQIYLTDLLKENNRQLTNMPNGACQPSWSPDGKKMVFVSPCDVKRDTYSQSNLYMMDVADLNIQPLPANVGGDFEPVWSPDGKKIAYTSLRDGYMQIYSYDVLTGKATRLTETPELKHARQASWSADSGRILYVYKRVDAYEVWAMNADGSNQERLYFSGSQLSNSYPVWALDEKSILFNQQKVNGNFEFPMLFTLDLNSNKSPRQIFLGVRSAENISYSPDGLWMAYESGGGRYYHVYYSNLSGGGLGRITEEDQFEDFDPTWRPLSK